MKKTILLFIGLFIAANAKALDVSLDIGVIPNNFKPIIEIKTNLPPGTEFTASIVNPINRGGTGAGAWMDAKVSNSYIVRFVPPQPVPAGIYAAHVGMHLTQGQPKNVLRVIGNDGELLTGDYISTMPGVGRGIYTSFWFEVATDGSVHNFAP
ncbi:MAG: hypothetical protein P4L87_10170 [Formivibrio sp.]|nr:hypothetical protein [Formivibrio sp.]